MVKKRVTKKTPTKTKKTNDKSFLIVGIGASAGGLEALVEFFSNIPYDTKIAFVVIQHLDPSHKSVMPEILRKHTGMKIYVAEDGMKIAPGCIYIKPPDKDVTIINQTLLLIERVKSYGERLPIDYFFRSLSEAQEEKAVCIILSGTGSDGTLGLKEIKSRSGIAMVQEEKQAVHDGMPRSAINTGLVDYVLPVEKIAVELIKNSKRPFIGMLKNGIPTDEKYKTFLQKIFVLLRSQTGHDFSFYKQNTIIRRIERRMMLNEITRLEDYVRYLQHNQAEIEILYKDILIRVTNFFREREAFVVLNKKVIPSLFENRDENHTVRVWVSGCATGEEAYTVAMLLKDHMDKMKRKFKVQVFASDIDAGAIEIARTGVYPASIANDVPPEYLKNFFTKEKECFKIKKSVRDMLVFSPHNVAKDPPFSKVDIICCRNLLIYMRQGLQEKVLQLFHYALNEGGYLLLGSSESIGKLTDYYTALDRKWKIYKCKKGVVACRPMKNTHIPALPSINVTKTVSGDIAKGAKMISFRKMTEELLLKKFMPACVMVNHKCDILFIHGRTGKYLEPSPGEAHMNLLEMVREGLRLELTKCIRKAIAQKKNIRVEEIKFKTNGGTQYVDMSIFPIDQPLSKQDLLMVIFEDTKKRMDTKPTDLSVTETEYSKNVLELEHELRHSEENLQATIEELRTSNEELNSRNEELQSANEESQSSNEELETSREELQSVNEELETVNSEYEKKIEELSRSNNDISNLLSSTDIGTLFLDLNMCIKRFTPSSTNIFKLIQTDIGRPIDHVVSNLIDVDLAGYIKEVLNALVSIEEDVKANNGRYYSMRIVPYRTMDNVVDGIVLTFVDITETKNAHENMHKITSAIEQSPSETIITNAEGNIEYVNPKFTEVTGYTIDEMIGKNPSILKSGKHNVQFYKDLWCTVTAGKEWRGVFHNRKKSGELYWERASISPVKNREGRIVNFIAVKEDITEHKRMEEELKEKSEIFQKIISLTFDSIIIMDNNGLISCWNKASEKLFGYSQEEAINKDLHKLISPEKLYKDSLKGLKKFRETGEGPFIDKVIILPCISKYGAEFYSYHSFSAINVKGKWNAIGIIRECPDQKQAKKEYNKTLEYLKK